MPFACPRHALLHGPLQILWLKCRNVFLPDIPSPTLKSPAMATVTLLSVRTHSTAHSKHSEGNGSLDTCDRLRKSFTRHLSHAHPSDHPRLGSLPLCMWRETPFLLNF
ncbi:hypothetical protein CDAR_273291 [Caerostris darwini]|uniref:Uncharacterized protein n=1 Tax=Caerostris darwini TaxID=1538125 RepID=A0AAV4TZ57_9ARAC|nr:hypothetical protein CDAR_273291 [Caerostris darwini]